MIFDVAVVPTPAQFFFGNDFALQADLLPPVLLTVLIEVPLFYLCGYRKFGDCLYFAAVNVISNLLLNEFLESTDAALYWQIILPCEIIVVILEFVLCSYRFVENRRKLLSVIIFTNAVSFLAGLAL
ncbi:MAG: hypothetical protein IKG61_06725 [Selenomonadaceae bacterium]|nr:hypothetical protein [Selenomonadaceae bacterium]